MEQDNSPLLGCAVIASAGVGLHDTDSNDLSDANATDTSITSNTMTSSSLDGSDAHQAGEVDGSKILAKIRKAVKAMVRVKRRIEPRKEVHEQYNKIFSVYQKLGPALQRTSHQLVSLSATASATDSVDEDEDGGEVSAVPISTHAARSSDKVRIVPSILSADFGYLAEEARLCSLHSVWIHIDSCDGGTLAPGAMTVGPSTVAAIHKRLPHLLTDVHLVHDSPELLIEAFAKGGATRLTLQLEQLGSDIDGIIAICHRVRAAGMRCGLCLAPDTDIHILAPLSALLSGPDPVVEYVDILAVKPGFAAQKFDRSVLSKIAYIKANYPSLPYIGIDGINEDTIVEAVKAGANFVIAGSSVFGKDRMYTAAADVAGDRAADVADPTGDVDVAGGRAADDDHSSTRGREDVIVRNIMTLRNKIIKYL